MMEKTVELKINPMRVITTILTLAAFVAIVSGAVRWMTKAEDEKRISDILQQGEDGE